MINIGQSDGEDFDELFPDKKEWFSPKEVGKIIGRSDQFVRNSIYCGKIMGHISNGIKSRGDEERTYIQVQKKMIILYLLETANYTSDMFFNNLSYILRHCSGEQLQRVEEMVKDLILNGKDKFKGTWGRDQ